METNDQGRRCRHPNAIPAARHGILAAAHLHYDLLRIRRLELEDGTLIQQHARELSTIYIRRGRRGIFHSRGLYTFRSAAPSKVSIKRLQSRLVRNGPYVWRACKVHILRILIAEGRPLGHPFAVGVSVLGEVSPVSRHRIGDNMVRVRGLYVVEVIQMTEHICNLSAMRCTVACLR